MRRRNRVAAHSSAVRTCALAPRRCVADDAHRRPARRDPPAAEADLSFRAPGVGPLGSAPPGSAIPPLRPRPVAFELGARRPLASFPVAGPLHLERIGRLGRSASSLFGSERSARRSSVADPLALRGARVTAAARFPASSAVSEIRSTATVRPLRSWVALRSIRLRGPAVSAAISALRAETCLRRRSG